MAMRVDEIVFIGTHDSAAYKFLGIAMPGNLVPGLSMKLLEFARKTILRDIINDWTLTQELSIYEQLKLGVRAFDMRFSQSNGVLLFSHSFSCILASDFCEQVQRFITENPGEIILIKVKPDWMYRNYLTLDHWKSFYLMCKNTFGNFMYPRAETMPFVEDCTYTGRSIFVDIYYDNMNSANVPLMFWTDYINRTFAQYDLFQSPSNNIVRNDVLRRIFLFGIGKKSLRNFGRPASKLYEEAPYKNAVNIWWMDFPAFSLMKKILIENPRKIFLAI